MKCSFCRSKNFTTSRAHSCACVHAMNFARAIVHKCASSKIRAQDSRAQCRNKLPRTPTMSLKTVLRYPSTMRTACKLRKITQPYCSLPW